MPSLSKRLSDLLERSGAIESQVAEIFRTKCPPRLMSDPSTRFDEKSTFPGLDVQGSSVVVYTRAEGGAAKYVATVETTPALHELLTEHRRLADEIRTVRAEIRSQPDLDAAIATTHAMAKTRDGRPAVETKLDGGFNINDSHNREALKAALRAAWEQIGPPGVYLTGTEDYLRRAVAAAASLGIPISNPELAAFYRIERSKWPNVPMVWTPDAPAGAPTAAPIREVSTVPDTPAAKLDYKALVAKTEVLAPVPSKDELIEAIRKRMIGQGPAIASVALYVRGQLAKKPREDGTSKPLVILLPGPTGTGKTELAKAVAVALKTTLVRFDMGEYGDNLKVSNLMGSSKGYVGSEEGGALPNAIRSVGPGINKTLVILFDEVEKAHASIWQGLLAFLDEGRASDSKGEQIAPKNTIIFMTSNRRQTEIAAHPENAKQILLTDGFFSSEMLGRVEKILPLPRLSAAEMLELTHVLLDRFASEYGILFVQIDESALLALFDLSRENAERAGGRGLIESIKDALFEDLLEIQGDGHAAAHLTLKDGVVHAVAA